MKKATLVIALAVMFSSCASIFGHSSSTVTFNCKPAGAYLEIFNRKGDTVFYGNTPATVQLKHGSGFFKREAYKLRFSMEGYDPKEWILHTKIEGWYWGNILIGGVIGFLIIDPATGAMYKLEMTDVRERLDPKANAFVDPAAAGLTIMPIQSVPDSLRKNLVKL